MDLQQLLKTLVGSPTNESTTSFLKLTYTTISKNTDILLQGFNWDSARHKKGWWKYLATQVAEIADARFDMIWLPPASDAASEEGYLPRELNNLNSHYGTRRALTNLIKKCHEHQLKVIADIVINHRVGTEDWADFTNPNWDNWTITYNDEWRTRGGNPMGRRDSGDNYKAARDLDHTNPSLQKSIIKWLRFMQKVGFDGWRYDYVRGYSGVFNGLYNEATNPYFSVGELWTDLDLNNPDPHRQLLADWVDATRGNSTIFDFTTKGILQEAVQGAYWRLSNHGKAPGLIGWWAAKSVTFIDNHDTGSSQAHWPFPADKIMEGYAYILTHPGIPCVFWDHFADTSTKEEILALIEIRKSNDIHSESSLQILEANDSRYIAKINEHLIVNIGNTEWHPGGHQWEILRKGKGYQIWKENNL